MMYSNGIHNWKGDNYEPAKNKSVWKINGLNNMWQIKLVLQNLHIQTLRIRIEVHH